MGRTIAAIAAVSAVAAAAIFTGVATAAQSGATAARTGSPIHAGDVLKYDLAIEMQIHLAPAPHTTQAPINLETSVAGTETITGLRSDPDGSVHASVNVAVRTNTAGQTQDIERLMLLKISPDGSMQPEGDGDPGVAQYIKTIDEAAKFYRNRKLHVGDTFTQTINLPGVVAVKVVSNSKVVAERTYRGYPTFAIASTGTGNISAQIAGAPAKGTVSVAGTTYVDQRDQLLVGQAVRQNIDATVAGAAGNRITATTTINLVLDSFTHGAAIRKKPTAPPTAAPSPLPAETTSPTPTPPDQYYTPTPAAPTPSPVVNPYPPVSP